MRRFIQIVLIWAMGILSNRNEFRLVKQVSILHRWFREKPKEIDDGMSMSQIGFPVPLSGRRNYREDGTDLRELIRGEEGYER